MDEEKIKKIKRKILRTILLIVFLGVTWALIFFLAAFLWQIRTLSEIILNMEDMQRDLAIFGSVFLLTFFHWIALRSYGRLRWRLNLRSREELSVKYSLVLPFTIFMVIAFIFIQWGDKIFALFPR